MAEPAKPTEPGEPPGEPKPWYRRFSLALSAFIMSVTITLINAFYSVRGSEIVVLEPEQVILYRDGEGDQAVLAFAMQLPMINAAGGQHGDVMLKADIQPGSDAPRFRYQAIVTPVFTNIPNAADRCDLGARCIAVPGLLVIERANEIVDIPGGAARSRYFSFVAASENCRNPVPACQAYGDFNRAVAQLGTRPMKIVVRVEFYGDGERTIECDTEPVHADYLRQIGWVGLACQRAAVSGDRFL
jgi:hypothetical protein